MSARFTAGLRLLASLGRVATVGVAQPTRGIP
jgi:hypothetical protein